LVILARAIQGDMPQGMAWHMQHLHGAVEQRELVAIVQSLVADGQSFTGRAMDACSAGGLQCTAASDMVGMVMGDENLLQAPAWVGIQPGQYRAGIARVDDRTALLLGIGEQPY